MRPSIIGMILTIVVILPSTDLEARINMGLVGSVGFPQGYMNLSVNELWYTRFCMEFPVKVELGFGESTSLQKHEMGGTVGITSWSTYLLGRYEANLLATKFTPYIATGVGIHAIYSEIFGENDILKGMTSLGNQFRFVSKAHLFFGCDYSLNSKWFLMVQGRVTYPSDIILDSGYLGLGLRIQ
ncbi:MAG: hypothetical protein P9X24_15405 [Candidatus Hatepunaea meridiana]|nr:hypothetical protein [Candidatus Hatepunaea meridiana]